MTLSLKHASIVERICCCNFTGINTVDGCRSGSSGGNIPVTPPRGHTYRPWALSQVLALVRPHLLQTDQAGTRRVMQTLRQRWT